ncbi:MAG: hypothetical protein ACTMKZ_00655 [Brevibacterium aurantiacum]|uniref:Uncharacterized protein n=2 Tax=Actinomycetota TaxID=201174 RepID=A0A2H1IZK2_BREAU|nr:hypothetical protein [Brevibacterium aurantiacum]PCC46262.1 hypothetical protein CIK64_11850 [Brevibacterium aurantiacum]RCS96671.1 hypothetical protein CIK61_05540 [Brevibacterium aurantiacum]TGD37154.1 hypothetical protein EB834_16965 [Brevibacterium aurantiacum]SMX80422.1 hypothetical protein BAUR920_01571 [Brevibacterium aurantiacum]SMX92941.1 hypothetical protein BAURA63_02800 [Brevibacterium aurantiacum]
MISQPTQATASDGTASRAVGLPPLLGQALGPLVPGAPIPPGPRMNPWDRAGARPVTTLPDGVKALLEGLWLSPGYHRGPDGKTTRIRQRPVPSAGGAYPVHTHLVISSLGAAGLDPGLYAYDHEHDTLLRRHDERPAGRRPGAPESADSWMVFTVQPGRSFGRYRHRAWPLWIADAAYALTAAEFLLDDPAETLIGPAAGLRDLLAFAPGADTGWWLSRGLVPEMPLVAIRLPRRIRVNRPRSTALARRRSPSLATFATGEPGAASSRTLHLAQRSGQAWLLGADRIEAWTVSPQDPPRQIARAVWNAHRCAARLVYDAAESDRWRCRPVSGFAATGQSWVIHALALLDAGDEESAP